MSEDECFQVAQVTEEEHVALKMLRAGEADSYQQVLALKVITSQFARTHDILFIPGAADQSAFLAGRAFVGLQILKHLNIPVGKLEDDGKQSDSSLSQA